MRYLLASIAEIHRQGADTLDINGWRITRITGGMNGLVFRAEREIGKPLAVKICQRDERNRAGREYAALRALDAAHSGVAPKGIYFTPEPPGLPGDVVIAEWLDGKVLEQYPPPKDRAAWEAILESLAEAHALTPEEARVGLPNAVLFVSKPDDLLRELHSQLARLPEGNIGHLEREQLEHLVAAAVKITPTHWQQPQLGLIHCDSNPRNMIENHGMIRLVDWENAGWADPAFDIADICANPAYGMNFPAEHHAWMMAEHGGLLDDPTLAERAAFYTRLMHVWWVLRNGRYLVETNTRLAGVTVYDPQKVLATQAMLWERAGELFNLNGGNRM
jgi:thiamine kinase-like enzyme